MPLPEKAIARLTRLGYRTEARIAYWGRIWESEGESFFWNFLRSDERAAEERGRWYPRLQQFVRECRATVPVPDPVGFSTEERSQHEILLSKMQQFAASEDRQYIFGRTPYQVPILSTSRVGLAAAHSLFGHMDSVVLLREEEKQQWFSEIYKANENGFWWYAVAWWLVHEDLDELTPDNRDYLLKHYPLPEGSVHWVVVSGIIWGSLAGGANYEAWSWNGTRAEPIESYCCDTF